MTASTNRQLISKALREAGIIEVGGTPDTANVTEALDLLQGLYSSFFGNELGENYTDINYGQSGLTNNYAKEIDKSSIIDSGYVPANVRVILNVPAAGTLYLDPSPMDGARLGVIDNAGNLATRNVTLNANGRKIESAATVVLSTNSLVRDWFYRADLGSWTKISDLLVDDPSPLPREFDDLFSTALAYRLNPRYGATTAPETSDVLKRAKKQFRNRYRQVSEKQVEEGLIRVPSNYYWKYAQSDITKFNRGS